MQINFDDYLKNRIVKRPPCKLGKPKMGTYFCPIPKHVKKVIDRQRIDNLRLSQ